MSEYTRSNLRRIFAYCLTACAVVFCFSLHNAHAFTVNVVGCDQYNNCNLPVSGFRWLLEEDNTNQSPPGVRVADSIGVDIHKSHAPVAAKGTSANTTITVPDSTKRYFISVLPDSGFAMGGAPVPVGAGTVTIKVHQYPIPTAQVSILVFEDHYPINNVFDPGERGLTGFTIEIADLAGPVTQDAFGNPLGVITTCTQAEVDAGLRNCTTVGEVVIKNLAPGKYGIRAIPPTGTIWVQTSTIEGTLTVDAWVKANEPRKFFEGFGTGFYHVFLGYVNPGGLAWALSPPGGVGTITGRNVYNHFARPPMLQGFYAGPPVSECWIGLNDMTTMQGLIAVPCDANSNFTISGVPAGTYQIVTWDKPLDALFGFNTVTVPVGGGTVDLGNVLSFRWFGTFKGSVFLDNDGDGFRDCVTADCNNVLAGDEVGIQEQNINIRFRDGTVYQAQPTDVMGEYEFSEVFPFFKWLVTEVDFARFKATGMTTAIDYGGPIPAANGWAMPSFDALNPQPQAEVNTNTGNNWSRTEIGPVLTQGMHLFLNQTNVIDWGKQAYATGENGGITGIVFYSTTRAENDPRYGAAEPWEPGIPRVQVNLYKDANRDGVVDDINPPLGIQLADVDNPPLGWSDGTPGKGTEDIDRNGNGAFDLGDAIEVATTDSWDDNQPTGCIQTLPVINGVQVKECFDNFGTWNQVRPAIFDGGYAFGSPAGGTLASGTYIVEAVPPPGYVLVKEEDKNVDFGDEYTPSPLLLPPACVGASHLVPAELSLFPGIPAYYAGQTRPLCDRKQITVSSGKNAAADFYFFTEVPKAARAVGFVNNDLAAEFDPNSPIYGEKSAPAWIPVSFQDWAGNEIIRVYTDEFGSYNALLPSTFTANIAAPSGMSPNIVTIILNHPLLPNGAIDPHYEPSYAVVPWQFQFMPGATSYLDTPIVPVAAFVGFPKSGADLEPADGTPVISAVSGPEGGPLVCSETGGDITITSAGSVQVPNPDYDPANGSPALITRDFGFGAAQGTVKAGTASLAVVTWSSGSISATVPAGLGTGQLTITRGDNGTSSEIGVTVHSVNCAAVTRRHVTTGSSIQAAIDAASPGDIILVDPGIYHENVIVYKNVILQGSGAGASITDADATRIYANPSPADRLTAWHNKVQAIRGNDPFIANEAPGILVFGDVPDSGFPLAPVLTPMIDGFMIFGAVQGGGVQVYNGADFLEVSNNKIRGNQGGYGGGVTVGSPDAGVGQLANLNVTVRHNRITGNGALFGGGGIMIASGADNYLVLNNIITGNLSRWNGGGIAHSGLSDNGVIAGNKITFNEVFFGAAVGGDGGGIYVAGAGANGTLPGALNTGAGDVTISENLVQGNLAGSGSGGGIRVTWVNGADVLSRAYALEIVNNMIVNNVAGYTGGGIALRDVSNSAIVNNTIANNDSTATAALAFAAGSLDSTPQGAGIVATAHSGALADATGQVFSNPALVNNIIRQNRSFYNDHALNNGAGGLAPNPTMPYWDLQVAGAAGALNPQYCLLTDTTGYAATNISGDPLFTAAYVNTLASSTVLDEGGNAITVRFTPVKPAGDYHIAATSPAVDKGSAAGSPVVDFDGDARPNGCVDIGADEAGALIFSITATAGPNGTIIPSGAWSVQCGGNVVFTITPDADYRLSLLTDNAVDVTGSVVNNRYSLTNVTMDHTVHAAFAPTPNIQVSPASLSFGGVLLFRTRTLSLTIQNTGPGDLNVSDVTINGPNAAMFQVTNWTGPLTIAPGGSSTLSVVFRPTTRGNKTATLRISSNDPDTPVLSVPMTGSGI